MKKRLFSILTILGIGCSFCSATDYEFTFMGNTFDIFDNYCGELRSDFSFSSSIGITDNNFIYSFIPVSDSQLILNGFDSDVILDSVCFPFAGPYMNCDSFSLGNTNFSNSSCSTSENGLGVCFSGLNINLKDYGYVFSGFAPYSLSDDLYRISFMGNGFICDNNSLINITFDGLFDGNQSLQFIAGTLNGNYYGIPTYLKLIIPDSPKFKVNYGNTSYEYELDSDLSIYLKSPVIQSGNTFTYDGSTGLNLFYNGTSQRYNKSNLYLDSMFWFNNNIFTPICL